MAPVTDCDTVADSTLLSDYHGQERREERNIQKIDLQHARRYGMEEDNNRNGRMKYTYGGIVFIYDPVRNREVTTFRSNDHASPTSGTLCVPPVHLSRKQEYLSKGMITRYRENLRLVHSRKDKWVSHTVLIIDMSGSMRRDDVNGARCRSDGVWIALARDFIGRQLETKRASIFDVVSVILMQEDSKVLYECFPIDWTLYCGFVENREWDKIRPSGPGNYLPALELAERLLGKNPCGSCALSLMFFSDGKPSDRGPFVEKMGAIASKFGRRLTVCCIGMADDTEDFSTLRAMVAEADSFGALASFNKPSLSTDSLSNIITSLVTSLASSKTEMTDLKTGKSRSVRADVLRE
jgi:hypothetical protein